MTLQFKTRQCNGILLRGFDVSLEFHNWQVCNNFCVCKCLLFQFFCLKGCLLCMLQFRISHLKIKRSAHCLDIIFLVIFGIPLRFLIFPNSFDSSVSFLCLRWLNDFLWFPKRSLNVVSLEPR